MSRQITVYQVWDGSDMAGSDTWWPTLKQAREHIHEAYGFAKSAVKLTTDPDVPSLLAWSADMEDGCDVHCMAARITMTAEGICDALTNEPNR